MRNSVSAPGSCNQLDTDKHILFVTNNATKSLANYKKKFDKLGVQAEVVCIMLSSCAWADLIHDGQDEVFGSAYATAVYVSTIMKLPKDKKVFVVGMKGLEEELAEEGISFIGGTVCAFTTVFPIRSPTSYRILLTTPSFRPKRRLCQILMCLL